MLFCSYPLFCYYRFPVSMCWNPLDQNNMTCSYQILSNVWNRYHYNSSKYLYWHPYWMTNLQNDSDLILLRSNFSHLSCKDRFSVVTLYKEPKDSHHMSFWIDLKLHSIQIWVYCFLYSRFHCHLRAIVIFALVCAFFHSLHWIIHCHFPFFSSDLHFLRGDDQFLHY